MTLTIDLDQLQVPVEVGCTSRRARLTIERDGSLRLFAAEDVGTSELREFLVSKREWIYRKLAEKELFHREPVTKEFVDGEGFLYLGRSHRLKLITVPTRRVALVRGRLLVPVSQQFDSGGAIIDWYQSAGEKWLRPRVQDWAQRLRVSVDRLAVEDLGFRWGVASPSAELRIHWATMQLRPALIDYVIAHEVVHLREPHHGPTFWRLLERMLPETPQLKVELGAEGAKLWFGESISRGDEGQT